jgi:hypothetical protein
VCAVSPRKVWTDRSRIQDFQRCPRLRYLSYHQNGMGLTSVRQPLPLAVGSSIHAGLAVQLRMGQILYNELQQERLTTSTTWQIIEEASVLVALDDFKKYALDPPDAERNELEGKRPDGTSYMDLRVDESVHSDFYSYLKIEQASLVEAVVRAYRRRKLLPVLEQFEVLEVEREGSWLLSSWGDGHEALYEHKSMRGETIAAVPDVHKYGELDQRELWFMSRPDALLRERSSNELYLLSYKTTGSWDARKARDAEHDMQGLSEGVEVERRLAEWWHLIHARKAQTDYEAIASLGGTTAMAKFLGDCTSPPRILGIRYEYLLKGERWRDKDLSQRFGFDARVQRSHLIRGYLNAGMAAGDEQWNWAWDYLKPDGSGETSKLNYRAWRSEPVWTHMPIAKWIDMLDDAAMLSVEGADRGYQSSAQATGTTATHPLDDVFIPPMISYRGEDDLRDWLESTEYQERQVAEHVAEVETATDEGERRSLLNKYFGMTRRACSYPTECSMTKICYGGAEIRSNPLGSGLYQIRKVNHPVESEGR